jgi:hypothetical protein
MTIFDLSNQTKTFKYIFMKHLFFSLLIAAASIFNTSNATETVASPQALASFQSMYTEATDISWSTMGELYKVSFIIDGKGALAFYDQEGALVAFSKNVSTSELPAGLQASLKKEMKEGWISSLFFMSSQEGNQYYVTLENADTKLVMKSVNGKKWTVYQKTTKI